MAAQLTYGYDTLRGVPGGKVDLTPDKVVTRMNDEADGKLRFGIAVSVGTDKGHSVKIPTTTNDMIEGVVIALPNTEQDRNGKVIIDNNRALSIMQKGHIWGRLASGVTPNYGETAYVSITGDDAGCFTNVAAGAIETTYTFGNMADDGIAVIVLD